MNDAEHGRSRGIEFEGGVLCRQPAAAKSDPLIKAIGEFRRAMAAFNREGSAEDDEVDALAAATYRPPRLVIQKWSQPAVSRDGAIEALRLARDAERDGDYRIVAPMLKAALDYLEAAL